MPTIKAMPLAELPKKEPEKVYTLAEYLEFDEQQEERHEYFNGKIRKLPMAKGPHNKITANIIAALHNAVRQSEKKLLVFASQQKVYLPQLNVSLYPDSLVVAEEEAYFDDDQQLLINPILIVEVLSPSTRHYDQVDKFRKYKTLDSFKEYVLVETDVHLVETRYRQESNLWKIETWIGQDKKIQFESIGCSIDLRDVYFGV